MKVNATFIGCAAACAGVIFSVTSGQAAVINDGTTTDGLTLVSNIPYLVPVGTYESSSTMTASGGTLRMDNGNHYTTPLTAVRAAWIAGDAPTSTTVTASADVQSSALNDADRAGVIILNNANNKGVIMYVKPGGNSFRIATLDLNTQSAADTVLTSTSMAGFVGTNQSNYSLSIKPNGANTDISAVITQGANTYSLSGSYGLGNIVAANAADIRVGYFGYYAAGYEDGFTVGNFDNLSVSPVPEPASLAAVGLVGGLLLRRRRS